MLRVNKRAAPNEVDTVIYFYQGETEFTKPYTQWDGMMFCITP